MNNERIVELEIKSAYQEELLETLNQVVAAQQRQIEDLQSTCQLLHKRINELVETSQVNKLPSSALDGQEIPPHY